jgi:DNA replication protein DnaC
VKQIDGLSAESIRTAPDSTPVPSEVPVNEDELAFPSLAEVQIVQAGDVALYTLEESDLQAQIDACPTCHGLGVLRNRLPHTHRRFGQFDPCPDCAHLHREQSRRRRDRLLSPIVERYSTLRGELLRRTFAGYDAKVRGAKPAYNAAVRWVRRVAGEGNDAPIWLYLWGPVGTGKTHLAAAAANYLRERRLPVVMTTMPQLLGLIRGMSQWDAKEKLLVHLSQMPVLIIDDVGAENKTGWTQENLFRIVDTRYNLALPTLIAANCDPGLLGEDRVASRIQDTAVGRVVPLKAKDYRTREAGERAG